MHTDRLKLQYKGPLGYDKVDSFGKKKKYTKKLNFKIFSAAGN